MNVALAGILNDHFNYLTVLYICIEEGLLYRARYFGDSDLYQRAQKMGTPSCSRLSEVQASLHG